MQQLTVQLQSYEDFSYTHFGSKVFYTRDTPVHTWRQMTNYGIAASCESQSKSRASMNCLRLRSCQWLATHGLLETRPFEPLDKLLLPQMRVLHNISCIPQLESLPEVSILATRASPTDQLFMFARYCHLGTGPPDTAASVNSHA
jgi:hypothetical protein